MRTMYQSDRCECTEDADTEGAIDNMTMGIASAIAMTVSMNAMVGNTGCASVVTTATLLAAEMMLTNTDASDDDIEAEMVAALEVCRRTRQVRRAQREQSGARVN